MATTETSTNTFVKKRSGYFILKCSSFAELRAFRFDPQAVNLGLHGVVFFKLHATKS
jgi:hypothetical protein